MTNFPTDQCSKKIKLYSLFQELAELSGDDLIPSLLFHFQRQSLNAQNVKDFYVDFTSNKKKQSTYFMYQNIIDALMWLYVKEKDVEETDPVGKGFIFSTSQIVKILRIPKGDLFVARETKELVEGIHYIREDRNSKAAARYAPILYDIGLTCSRLYNISYNQFCQPDFDLEEHKRKELTKVFDRINKTK